MPFPSYLVSAALLVVTAMSNAAAPAGHEVMPGVFHFRVGEPERLTPKHFRSAAPNLVALSSLPKVGASPVGVTFRQSPRGCIVDVPAAKDEKFYGLGLSTSTFELSGRKAWVIPSDHPEETTNESHAPTPFYVSSKGYGVYVDTARYACFSFANVAPQQGKRSVTIDVPGTRGVDVYVFAGPTALDAIRRYNLFSGGGPVPPLWGLGIAYRGKGDSSASDVLALAKEFRSTDVPCDIFGIEPGWQTQTYSCSFLWNRSKYPDPDAFIRDMHAMDFRMSFWEHPFTHPTSPIHDALKPYAGSHLVWNGLVPDFATAEARKLFVRMQTESLFSKGVDSMKIDEVDAQPFKPDPWSFPDFATFPSGLDGEQMHSLFGVLSQQTLLAPFRDRNKRTWGLVRNSGALATPLPYTVYSDSYTHADYVRGLVKSGFGGLLWTPEVRDAKSVDDLVRRVQTVIFSPYAMINCWYMKMPPWIQIDAGKSNAGIVMPEAPRATELVRSAFRLRMSLLPYLYSAFIEYHQTGTPPVRSLSLDFPSDTKTATVDDQFMFGPSLMVAPMIDGQSKRSVYFPPGEWFDFFTGERIAGGQRLEVSKPLDQLPLYVRSGSVIPVAEPLPFVARGSVLNVHVRVYGAAAQSAVLFEDDGETFDFENGIQTRVTLTWKGGKGSIARSGAFGHQRFNVVDWKQVESAP